MYTLMTDMTTSKTLRKTTAQALDVALCFSLLADTTLHIDTPLLFLCQRLPAKQDYCRIDSPHDAFLGSDRLETLFAQMGVSYRTYPAVLLHQNTRDILSTTHKFIVLQQIDLNDCIDWQKSQIWIDPVMGIRILTILELNTQIQAQAVPAFCLRQRSTFLVHDTVREQIIRRKLKGIAFVALNAFFAPGSGREEQQLRAILAKDTQQAKVWYELALVLMHLFRYQEACEAIQQALSLEETYPRANYRYATLLTRLGETEKALQTYQKEMLTSPEHFGWQEYCALFSASGRSEEAVAVALHYLKEPFWQQIRGGWYHLNMAYLQLQRYQEALTACEQAFLWRGSPREDFLYLAKGQALFGLQRFEEALQWYEKGLEWSPASIQLWQAKADVLGALEQIEAAQEAQQQVEFWESFAYKRLHGDVS